MDELLNQAAAEAGDQTPAEPSGAAHAAAEETAADAGYFTITNEDGTPLEPADAEKEKTPDAPERKKPGMKLWLFGAAAALAVVAVILLAGRAERQQEAVNPPAAQTEQTDAETPAEEGAQEDAAQQEANYVSYTVSADALDEQTLAKPIAVCGDQTMDNRMLNLYYWQQYYTFANSYSAYLSYIIDTTKGLDEQLYSETETWQQAFLSGAADMFHSITALNLQADAEGFALSEADEASLASVEQELDAVAVYYGMEDGLSYLQALFGPAVTMEDYVAFERANLRASQYLQKYVEALALDDETLSDYYDQHAQSYEQNRVLKVDKPMVDVRHILIIPSEQNEDGTYTDEAWQEAEKTAQALLDEWKAAEASEESFAALAGEHSEDPGSASNGGLYTDVYPGQMVEPFEAWCFDDARRAGDTGIVKTDYGYHIMYYVAQGSEIYWLETARGDYQSEQAASFEDAMREKYPMETTLDNAAIFDVLAESRQAAAEASAENAEDAAAQ